LRVAVLAVGPERGEVHQSPCHGQYTTLDDGLTVEHCDGCDLVTESPTCPSGPASGCVSLPALLVTEQLLLFITTTLVYDDTAIRCGADGHVGDSVSEVAPVAVFDGEPVIEGVY